MLQKNVYVLFPAGYGGNYINWSLSISDFDTRKSTVIDPINKIASKKFGGEGTSHLHQRVPTHQGFPSHTNWVILNRPTEPKIYVINCTNKNINWTITELLSQDKDGVIICIHDEGDASVHSYGTANVSTKWPTFIAAEWAVTGVDPVFDVYSINKGDTSIRNWAVNHQDFFVGLGPLDYKKIVDLLQRRKTWYTVRHENQPHEVNLDTYLVPDMNEMKRVYQLSCRDLLTDAYPSMIKTILDSSGISDNYDLDHITQFHSIYVQAQKNSQWFESYAEWESSGKLDEYLLSHPIIEAQIIKRILKHSNRQDLQLHDSHQWAGFFNRVRGPGWPVASDNEYDFFRLPLWVQQEIRDFGYAFKVNVDSEPVWPIVELDWENCSTEHINDLYQRNK